MPSYKITITVGGLLRRGVRRQLQQRSITFTEDKGLIDSQFVITGLTRRQYDILMDWFNVLAA